MSGPLTGVKVLELAGIGPGPFCGMLLADMGADVLRVDRLQANDLGLPVEPKYDIMSRGRRSIALDLKQPAAIQTVLALAARADALIEGFRPGVTERLGLGPDACLARNPRLVYGRITGWGQDGPLAQAAGHDINYIALSGALYCIGRKGEAPVPPLNLVGDFGGGGMLLAFGIACALFEARASGQGQVIDAAMSEGVASLWQCSAGAWPQATGAISAASMCSTPARPGTTPMKPPTASTWPSAPSRGAFTPNCSRGWAWMPPPCRDNSKSRAGPNCAPLSLPPSKARPGMSGAAKWKARTCASRRCCRSPKRRSMRTTARAAPSSTSTA